jgi:hypothetical protein
LALLPIVAVALAVNAETETHYVYTQPQQQTPVKKGVKAGTIKMGSQTIKVVKADEQSKTDAKRFREQAKTNKAAYDQLMAKYTKKCNEALELQDQVNELQHVTQEGLEFGNLSENVFYFCTLANNFVGNVGGLVWLTDRINDMTDKEKDLFLKAAHALNDFSQMFAQNMERIGYGTRTDTAVPLLAD